MPTPPPRTPHRAFQRGCAALLAALCWLGANAAQTLTIGREESEGPLADVSATVVAEAFQRSGLTLALKRYPLMRSIEMADAGEIDGELHRIADAAARYHNLVPVPTPINRVDVAVYGASPEMAAKSRSEVAALNIVVQRGVFVLAKYSSGMSVSDTASSQTAIALVANGRVDAAMLPYLDAEGAIRSGPFPNLVRWPRLWASEPLYLMLHRRHALLAQRLNATLAQMKKEGRIERIYLDMLSQFALKPLPADPQDPAGRTK